MDLRIASLALCGAVGAVPRLAAAESVADRLAAAAEVYQLSGLVTDAARTPVPEAEVAVVDAGGVRRRVVTTADGRFALGDLPAGRHSLRVRRLGYEQRVVDVRVGAGGQPTFVEIVLAKTVQELEEVVVDTEFGGRLREFRERRQQRGTFGKFLEQKEIRQLGATNPSDLFRSVPGISIRAASMGGNTIRIRGCQPMVWVDGQRILGAELDDVIQPGEIAAIEFYPSSAGVPAQYLERGNRLCGLILVWTKIQ